MFLKIFIPDEGEYKLKQGNWRGKVRMKKWKRIAWDILIGYTEKDIKYKITIAQIMYLCCCEEENHKSFLWNIVYKMYYLTSGLNRINDQYNICGWWWFLEEISISNISSKNILRTKLYIFSPPLRSLHSSLNFWAVDL